MIGGVLFAGFMLEKLFLEDWPWWAWGIAALVCFVALAFMKWQDRRARRRKQSPPEEAAASSSPAHFTKAEAKAFIEQEMPVYWPIPVVRWVNTRATRKNATRLLAKFENEDQFEFDREHGYKQMALFTRVAAERLFGDDE